MQHLLYKRVKPRVLCVTKKIQAFELLYHISPKQIAFRKKMWQIFFLSEMMSPFRKKKNKRRELLACGASSAAVLSMFYSVTGNTCKIFFSQLTILTGKNCYTEFSVGIVAWLLLTFFIYLHNQLSSIYSIITC